MLPVKDRDRNVFFHAPAKSNPASITKRKAASKQRDFSQSAPLGNNLNPG